jgi:hypothetical protein
MNITSATVELLKFATSRATNWLLPLVLSAVTWVISVTLINAPFMAESLATVNKEKLAAWLTGAIVAAVMGLINGWTNNKLKAGNAAAQTIIDNAVPQAVNKDGIIGPNSLRALTELALKAIKHEPKP